jgi:hypothetical protein
MFDLLPLMQVPTGYPANGFTGVTDTFTEMGIMCTRALTVYMYKAAGHIHQEDTPGEKAIGDDKLLMCRYANVQICR